MPIVILQASKIEPKSRVVRQTAETRLLVVVCYRELDSLK